MLNKVTKNSWIRPFIWICKVNGTHPPPKFRGNPFISCIILLTNQRTNKQTNKRVET